MDNTERVHSYNLTFPKYPPLAVSGRWIYGMWLIGNNYKGSGFYGSYPPTYRTRMDALFPDAKKILHVCSGSLPEGDYVRFDLNQPCDVQGDAEELSKYFEKKFDLVYVDPPYSVEDALHYKAPMLNRTKVLQECRKVCQAGGHIVWLDQAFPMFRKTELKVIGTIGVVRSTNHRVRVAFIFEVL